MSTVAGPCAVFMGNLNDQCTKCEICSMIVYVFNDVLAINITKDNVNISLSYHSKCFTATIFVPNEIYQKLAVESLDETMVPLGLIKKGRKLRVDYFRAGHEKENVGEVLSYQNYHDEIKVMNYRKRMRRKRTGSQANTSHYKQSVNGVAIPQEQPTSNASDHIQRSTDAYTANTSNRLVAEFLPDQLDKVDYLTKNQQLGNENRTLEFKRGGGAYLTKHLGTELGRYVSGFLNSSGGTLLIGVDDEGFVQGVSSDHKEEDRVRLIIDSVINRIEPTVPPNMYSVSFIPVQDTNITCSLNVIKITVGAGKTKMLYSSPDGDVFIRRDGGVQGPLKAKDLQEIYRMKIEEDFERKEADLKNQIKILESQLEDASLGHDGTSSGHTRSSKSVVCVLI